jgi:glucose/arabinose dehydrogenase
VKRLRHAAIVLALAGVAIAAVVIALVPVSLPVADRLSRLMPWLFDAPRAELAIVEERLAVPAGFGITLFAADVAGARTVRATPAGDLLVASMRQGEIVLLEADRDGDGASDGRRVLLAGLDGPSGLALHDGVLYVGEAERIVRVPFDAAARKVAGEPAVFVAGLPRVRNHRGALRFGPDGLLYVTIGSTCNVCIETDERRAAMLRFAPDGRFLGVYATGLRNSAGFDWRDADGSLYASDNGRDLLGDDFPPCELNRVVEGGFYGWPFANGERIADPDLGAGREDVIASSIPPAFAFRPHNAPLGMVFLRSARQPAPYQGAAVVALHGSWNRSTKDGYKVVSLHWGADGSIEARDFVSGFLGADGSVIGRPVDVTEDADGNVYVSDDYASAVYRVAPGRAGTLPGVTVARSTATGSVRGGPKPEVDATARRAGAAHFEALACVACHSPGLEAPGAEGRVVLAGLAQRYTVDTLAAYLRNPNPPMPPVAEAAETVDTLARWLLATY